ncbi:MAG: DUF3592 domain-containing protein [Anaerolineales bacterium]|nr:DUF3592 domain-containing protein [Anaerolineales bacterium]
MDIGRILTFGLCVLFSLWGLYSIIQGIRLFQLAGQTRAWPSTLGIVKESRVHKRFSAGDSTEYQPLVRYTFSYRGQEFESDQIFLGAKQFSRPSKALPYVQRYPEGQSVTVYYNPQDPYQSVLETGHSSRIYVVLVSGVVLIGVAVFIFFLFLRS